MAFCKEEVDIQNGFPTTFSNVDCSFKSVHTRIVLNRHMEALESSIVMKNGEICDSTAQS